jgi:hypothetical protein
MRKYIPFVKVMFYVLLVYFVAIGTVYGWVNLLYLAFVPFSLKNLVIAFVTAPVFVIGAKTVLAYLIEKMWAEKKWEGNFL